MTSFRILSLLKYPVTLALAVPDRDRFFPSSLAGDRRSISAIHWMLMTAAAAALQITRETVSGRAPVGRSNVFPDVVFHTCVYVYICISDDRVSFSNAANHADKSYVCWDFRPPAKAETMVYRTIRVPYMKRKRANETR